KTMKFAQLLGALALGSTVASFLPAGVVHAETKQVHIGSSVRSLFSLPLYVADQKGYFKAEGLDVDISFFKGGPPATAAMICGSVDLIVASLENQLKLNQKGQPVRSILNMQSDFSGALAV